MASGDCKSLDFQQSLFVLLEGTDMAAAADGAWVSPPAGQSLHVFSVATADPLNPASVVLLTANVEIQGFDSDVPPTAAMEGVTIGLLTPTVNSLTNTSYVYRFIRARNTGVNPVTIRIVLKTRRET